MEFYKKYFLHAIFLYLGLRGLIMRIEKSLVFPRGVVPVLCMLNIIFVTLKQRYGKAYMVLCRDWKIALTLLFVLCIIHV